MWQTSEILTIESVEKIFAVLLFFKKINIKISKKKCQKFHNKGSENCMGCVLEHCFTKSPFS